jgi:hypothetical protein
MTLITFEDGKPLKKEDGTIGTEQACCCNVCGTDCTETITVDVSVAGYETQLVFTVIEGFASYSEDGEGPFDFFNVSAFLFCSLVDGVPTWQLSVSVCWAAGANEGSEQWDGTVAAGPDGCPPDGEIPLEVTFGDGVATVSASVS